jgi:hypothetical protein
MLPGIKPGAPESLIRGATSAHNDCPRDRFGCVPHSRTPDWSRKGRSPGTEVSVKVALRLTLAAIGLLAVASTFVHPVGPIKGQRTTGPLMAGAATNPAITRVLERSCQNCHSERTHWPWYSYVAPMSWLIENDVYGGRSHMNLSRWEIYTAEQQVELLTKMGVEVRNRRMPLPKYLQLHPESRLSDDEVRQVYEWVRSERRRLRTAAESKSKTATD